MFTLKEARKKAAKVIKVPAYSTLGNWVTGKIISGSIEKEYKGKAGGIRGFYPDRIAGEIIAAQRLKSTYSLSDIKKARVLLELDVKKEVENIYIKDKLTKRKHILDSKEEEIHHYLIKYNDDINEYDYDIHELSKKMEERRILEKEHELLKNYADELIKASEEVNKNC